MVHGIKMVRYISFHEFCENTTSHCTKYIVMKRRSLFEKMFWRLIFLVMIFLMYQVLKLLINNWMYSPTVMFIENTETAIKEIPFPSITICPSSQIRKWVWESYSNTNNSYWENLQKYQTLICSQSSTGSSFVSKYLDVEYMDYDLIKNLVNDNPISCPEIFQSTFRWQNYTEDNFCRFVQPILRTLGVCYTINKMPAYQMFNEQFYKRYVDFFNITYAETKRTDWNSDDGYPSYILNNNNIRLDVIPFRTNGVSYYHRLRLTLYTMEEEFMRCPNYHISTDFFLVTFSNPTEYDLHVTRSFIVPDTYTTIQITPSVKKINKDLRWRSPETRECFLHNERKLSIFQQYTELNCKVECLINKTIAMCGCINFERAFLVTKDINICGPAKSKCMLNVKLETPSLKQRTTCNCLPTCSIIEYEITHTSHDEDWTYFKMTNLVKNNSEGATIEFLFNTPYFTAYKAKSIVDLDSLISYIGGTLSLFLGINIINLFEILYVLIQIVCNYIVHMIDYP